MSSTHPPPPPSPLRGGAGGGGPSAARRTTPTLIPSPQGGGRPIAPLTRLRPSHDAAPPPLRGTATGLVLARRRLPPPQPLPSRGRDVREPQIPWDFFNDREGPLPLEGRDRVGGAASGCADAVALPQGGGKPIVFVASSYHAHRPSSRRRPGPILRCLPRRKVVVAGHHRNSRRPPSLRGWPPQPPPPLFEPPEASCASSSASSSCSPWRSSSGLACPITR
jgi:hypothetical protein